MIDISKGRYWDEPLGLVRGCTPVSAGCKNCWSASIAHRFHKGELTDDKGRFDGTIQGTYYPLIQAGRRKKQTVYAVWNDLFHQDVPSEFIEMSLDLMKSLDRLTFLILAKRPERLSQFDVCADNIWVGTSVEDQKTADERIPLLCHAEARHRFLSVEPMLGPIDNIDAAAVYVDAVILGGEKCARPRPIELDWVRNVRDACARNFYCMKTNTVRSTPFFLKHIDKANGRVLDGVTHDELPWVKGAR